MFILLSILLLILSADELLRDVTDDNTSMMTSDIQDTALTQNVLRKLEIKRRYWPSTLHDMLKGKDRRVEPTEHDIYKFAPVFPKGTASGTYLRYYQHRERVLTGTIVLYFESLSLLHYSTSAITRSHALNYARVQCHGRYRVNFCCDFLVLFLVVLQRGGPKCKNNKIKITLSIQAQS